MKFLFQRFIDFIVIDNRVKKNLLIIYSQIWRCPFFMNSYVSLLHILELFNHMWFACGLLACVCPHVDFIQFTHMWFFLGLPMYIYNVVYSYVVLLWLTYVYLQCGLSLAPTRRFFLALICVRLNNEMSSHTWWFFIAFFCCNLLKGMTNSYFCVIHDEITHCDTKAMTNQICKSIIYHEYAILYEK